MIKMIYLDNAATTPLSQEVFAAMEPFFSLEYGNPSSVHQAGRRARQAVEQARRSVAGWLSVMPDEVVFTSGGTESIHSALLGAYLAGASAGRRHIVTTAVEHHAVLHTCEFLESLGATVTVVPVQKDGQVRVEDILLALQTDTVVVSIMAVNNELGTILPIREIALAVKKVDSDILVHSDMVQWAGAPWFALSDSGLDLASFSAHKLHGPKGVGALFVRRKTPLTSVLRGGEQEKKRRAGTENVPGIVGFGAAAAKLAREHDDYLDKLKAVRDLFWSEIRNMMPGVVRNSPEDGAPGILNVAFSGIKSETLLIRLDLAGVMASAGSACSAGSIEPSHVLLACGMTAKQVQESVRFSFSTMNTPQEAVEAARRVREAVEFLRNRQSSNH